MDSLRWTLSDSASRLFWNSREEKNEICSVESLIRDYDEWENLEMNPNAGIKVKHRKIICSFFTEKMKAMKALKNFANTNTKTLYGLIKWSQTFLNFKLNQHNFDLTSLYSYAIIFAVQMFMQRKTFSLIVPKRHIIA